MKSGYTHIHFILDRSGSMSTIRDDAIGGFNSFLKSQQEAPGECTMTLVQFDTQDPYEVIVDRKRVENVKNLTAKVYVPRGGTPLYDAVGRGINELGKQLSDLAEDQRPEKVLFVILTDGHENESREFTHAKVQEMIEHQTGKYAWSFMFLGANMDAVELAKSMSINPLRAMTFAANKLGTQALYASMTKCATAYRAAAPGAAADRALCFDSSDYAAQAAAGAATSTAGASQQPPLDLLSMPGAFRKPIARKAKAKV